MPSRDAVMEWLSTYPDFAAMHAHARRAQAMTIADVALDKAGDATDVASASASSAYTKTAALLLPAFDRATFGAQVQHQVSVTSTLSDDELRLRLIEAAAKSPEACALIVAQRPDLIPVLRQRGTLPELSVDATGRAGEPPPLPPTSDGAGAG